MPSTQLPKSWQSTTRQNAPSTLPAKSAKALKHTKRKNKLTSRKWLKPRPIIRQPPLLPQRARHVLDLPLRPRCPPETFQRRSDLDHRGQRDHGDVSADASVGGPAECVVRVEWAVGFEFVGGGEEGGIAVEGGLCDGGLEISWCRVEG